MKLKCSICKKEFDKNLMSVECPDCYQKGYNNEFNRWKKKFVEEILKEIEKEAKGMEKKIKFKKYLHGSIWCDGAYNGLNKSIEIIKQKAECLEEKNAKKRI